ncbi:hypothetical protein B9Z19DRAFT_1068722 [Tuber borchii]|uniref:Uncharacterized protein n=1 Tax=Tuber borchii TaxID=42251 RepID=A0A2T6ZE50_TUBBO|nr:hypothetical protein B9Z19DRAFT_1068722 [Tuber borchii]
MKLGKEWIDNKTNKLRATRDQLPAGSIDLIAGNFLMNDWFAEIGGFDQAILVFLTSPVVHTSPVAHSSALSLTPTIAESPTANSTTTIPATPDSPGTDASRIRRALEAQGQRVGFQLEKREVGNGAEIGRIWMWNEPSAP